MRVRTFLWLLVVSIHMGPALRAQQVADNFRNLARNPLGDAVRIPIVESISLDTGPAHRIGNALQVLPIIPLPIGENWLLLPRIVVTPVACVPDVTQVSGGNTGLGDTVPTLFISPAHAGKLIWGVGPSVLIPTATGNTPDTGRLSMGASLAVVVQPNWGVRLCSRPKHVVAYGQPAPSLGEPNANRDILLL